jgi:hypothetical protein
MAGNATHALVADSLVGQFIIAKGDPYTMEKAFKEWHKVMFGSLLFGGKRLIKLPTADKLPSTFKRETFLGLSVVAIPQQHQSAVQASDDPRMSDFINRSNQVSQEAAPEKPGVDMLDEGLTR